MATLSVSCDKRYQAFLKLFKSRLLSNCFLQGSAVQFPWICKIAGLTNRTLYVLVIKWTSCDVRVRYSDWHAFNAQVLKLKTFQMFTFVRCCAMQYSYVHPVLGNVFWNDCATAHRPILASITDRRMWRGFLLQKMRAFAVFTRTFENSSEHFKRFRQ